MLLIRLFLPILVLCGGLLGLALDRKPKAEESRSVRRKRVALIASIVSVTVATLVVEIAADRSGVQEESRLNTLLETTLSSLRTAEAEKLAAEERARTARKERRDLEDQLASLRRMIEPVAQVARELFPALDQEEAIQRLAEEVQLTRETTEALGVTTQQLEVESRFRPLTPGIRRGIVDDIARAAGVWRNGSGRRLRRDRYGRVWEVSGDDLDEAQRPSDTDSRRMRSGLEDSRSAKGPVPLPLAVVGYQPSSYARGSSDRTLKRLLGTELAEILDAAGIRTEGPGAVWIKWRRPPTRPVSISCHEKEEGLAWSIMRALRPLLDERDVEVQTVDSDTARGVVEIVILAEPTFLDSGRALFRTGN